MFRIPTPALLTILAFGLISCARNPENILLDAAKRGDAKVVRESLQKGIDANSQDRFGTTALMIAAREGHAEIVQILLEKNANVNLQNSSGMTALMNASFGGYMEIVKALLEKGADVNAHNTAYMTAAKWADQKGHKEIADYLEAEEKKVLTKKEAEQPGLVAFKKAGDLLVTLGAVNVSAKHASAALEDGTALETGGTYIYRDRKTGKAISYRILRITGVVVAQYEGQQYEIKLNGPEPSFFKE
jgi:ankyrin repeat protein